MPLVIRFVMFGAILAFYIYYIGGCLVGRYLPRPLAPNAVKSLSSSERDVRCFWGEAGPGVKLLFEVDEAASEDASFPSRQWNRLLEAGENYRYFFLHILHFEGKEPVTVGTQSGLVALSTADGTKVKSISVNNILKEAGDRLPLSSLILVRSMVPPEENIEVEAGHRYRLLVAFPETELAGKDIVDVSVRGDGESIPLTLRRVESQQLAQFMLKPSMDTPEAWRGADAHDAIEGLAGPGDDVPSRAREVEVK